ncbi:MAG: hypothetical protein JXR05_05855 [Flavobacteriaceae bacterium]
MKKSILNTGKALDKAEQKQINGGTGYPCGPLTCYFPETCGQVNGVWACIEDC